MTVPALTTPTAGRLRLTAYAGQQLLLWVPTLVGFVVTVVGGALALVTVGLPLLVGSVPLLHWVSDRHRAMAAQTLGVPVSADRLPAPEGGKLVARVATR